MIAVPADYCYGQAQHTLKSTCITGILEAEAAYMLEFVIRFIDVRDDLVFQEALIALKALIIQDRIGLTEEHEQVGKIPDKIPGKIPDKIPDKIPGKIPAKIPYKTL